MADERRGAKRPLDTSSDFELGGDAGGAAGVAVADVAAPAETAASVARRVSQRQKQIDFGKNTPGYVRYTLLVPREKRRPTQPRTPDVNQACAKRQFDALVREWRRTLHRWDPEELRVQAARDTAALKPAQASAELAPPRQDVAPPLQDEAPKDSIYGSFDE